MGGSRQKRKRREDVIVEEVIETREHIEKERKLQSMDDDSLFQIDTKGALPKKLRSKSILKKESWVHSNKFKANKVSKAELDKIERLRASTALVNSQQNVASQNEAETRLTDLWASEAKAQASKNNVVTVATSVGDKQAKKRVMVPSTNHKVVPLPLPKAGQSYNPDEDSHKKTIEEAATIELKRIELARKKMVSTRTEIDPELKKLATAVTDDEHSSDEENDKMEEDTENKRLTRKQRKGKLTQTDKNKRLRSKLQQVELHKKKQEKQFLKSINRIREVSKELKKEEREQQERREQKDKIREEKLQEEPKKKVGGKLLKDEPPAPMPVLLSDELSGSLRRVKPKGNMVQERFDSLHRRNMVEIGRAQGRKKNKKTRYIEK